MTTEFRSRGVRALVLLHDREVRAFLAVWRRASALGVVPPETTDPDCKSLEAMAHHVFRAARGYLTWVCEVLERPMPSLPQPPEPEGLGAEAGAYVETLAAAYREHMAWMPNEVLDSPKTYMTRWNLPIAVESMLEHAVVHPMRHRLQIEQWLEGGQG